jgi:hypothetical protein
MLLAQLALHALRPLQDDAARTERSDMVGGVPGAEAAMMQHAQAVTQLKGTVVEAGTAGSAAGVKRWHRSAGWRPCAVGNLPDAFDPNGTMPHMGTAALLGASQCEQPQAEPMPMVGAATAVPTAEGLLTEFCEVPESPGYFDRFDVLGACGDEQMQDMPMLQSCGQVADMQAGLGCLAGSTKLLLG